MFSIRRSITAVVLLSAVAAPCAALTTIDFETPSLGVNFRMVINPYVASGVTFTAVPVGLGDEVVGLVKNNATSACTDPADANQKLGTGRSSAPGGAIGLAGFGIRADFPSAPVVTNLVSVEYQTGADWIIRLRLFNAGGTEIGSASGPNGPPDGTCGNPGGPRARSSLLAVSSEPAAYAIMDALPLGGLVSVMAIDNFSFGVATVPVATSSWGRLKLHYR